jgi:4-amino-4-deoxy-L-arabinose transferase-like glycosyltransferase
LVALIFIQPSIIRSSKTACRISNNASHLSMTNRTRDSLVLSVFCAFFFFYSLAPFGLIGADEPRYAQVAREMLDRRDWITPTLGGKPWLEKPPLYYWQAMLAYTIFGVSDWAARVPAAVDATVIVLAAYLFLRRLCPGFELDGALITASCAGIIGYARAASMDMTLASAFTVAMLAWWTWRDTGRRVHLAAFYVCVALGTLAKGPVAPFLAAAIIVLYSLAARELRLIVRTLWFPGFLLFCAIALPWYVAVQARNPQFFRIFILEHNLARFSTDMYHHTQPLWYYLPVTLLASVPWTIFVVEAFTQTVQAWWSASRSTAKIQGGSVPGAGDALSTFAGCWFIVPVAFFSVSQSKLPGYILPAVPAGALVLVEYLRQHLSKSEDPTAPRGLVVPHALVATIPIVPALLIAYLVTQHRLPGGQPLLIALGVAFLLFAGMVLTLFSRMGLRMLRFVTLIPVVLVVAAVLKIGSPALDQTLSARPLAREISSLETHRLPLAVYAVSRETEYGLTFYRNQQVIRYEWGRIPAEEHLVVTREDSQLEIAEKAAGRRISFLGNFAPQHLDCYWVAAATASHHEASHH